MKKQNLEQTKKSEYELEKNTIKEYELQIKSLETDGATKMRISMKK